MIFECVPNFSGGPWLAQELSEIARARADVIVLGAEGDEDHARTVLTLAGEGPPLLALMRALCVHALSRVDLGQHSGVHPRSGVIDVVPFVPLEGASMEQAAALAREFGSWAATELQLPVYFYEQSATRPEFEDLAALRRSLRSESPASPDLGPLCPDPKRGVLITGARELLVAFNINLARGDMATARRLARALRASSGGLPGVKAKAFWLASRQQSQVSFNLTRLRETGPGEVFLALQSLASGMGAEIAESELIGFLPRRALTRAASALMRCVPALDSRVLEDQIEALRSGAAWRAELARIASTQPAPGGGTSAAMTAALAAATAKKACQFYRGESLRRRSKSAVLQALTELEAEASRLAAEDEAAFGALMSAWKEKGKSAELVERRRKAQERAFKSSQATIFCARRVGYFSGLLVLFGNPNLINDAALGYELALSAARGGLWNALANVRTEHDKRVCVVMMSSMEKFAGRIRSRLMERYGVPLSGESSNS